MTQDLLGQLLSQRYCFFLNKITFIYFIQWVFKNFTQFTSLNKFVFSAYYRQDTVLSVKSKWMKSDMILVHKKLSIAKIDIQPSRAKYDII